MRQCLNVFCHQDSTCHSHIKMALSINISLNFVPHTVRSAPNLFGTLCWATDWLHLALQTHKCTICPFPVNHREVTVRAQMAKKRQAAFSLTSLQYTHHFPFMLWFKAVVWEWAFAGHNNVIIWFAAQEWVRHIMAHAPIPAMWNCCVWIHRGAVYCGTAHSSHCFCAFNDRLGHNGNQNGDSVPMWYACRKFMGPDVRN